MTHEQESHLYTILSRLRSGQFNFGQVIAEVDLIIKEETATIRTLLNDAQAEASKYQSAVETYQRLLKNKEDLINCLQSDNSKLIQLLDERKSNADIERPKDAGAQWK